MNQTAGRRYRLVYPTGEATELLDWDERKAAYIHQAGRLDYGPDGAERELRDARTRHGNVLARARAVRVLEVVTNTRRVA